MARIEEIKYHLPDGILENDDLAEVFPKWPADKIYRKTGIRRRHVVGRNETSADLAVNAAMKIFDNGKIDKDTVGSIVFVTQTPNYLIPSTACEIHRRLGMPRWCGAFDVNQGCAGYIYGLQLAKSLLGDSDYERVLVLTGDTYSRIIRPEDFSLRCLFGDAGTATIVSRVDQGISTASFGTQGDRQVLGCTSESVEVERGRPYGYLTMDGPAVMKFTLETIPMEVSRYLVKKGVRLGDFDRVVLHQANKFILDAVHAKIGCADKGVVDMEECGNTVSSSIPIALNKLINSKGKESERYLLVGFGVGLSWGIMDITIT